jgi:predicted O-methyltransferase YrrM
LAKDENREFHTSALADGSKEGMLVEDNPRTYNSEEGVKFWIDRLRAGDDVFDELARAYGNEGFAATPGLLKVAWGMAKNSAKVLECGSGLSTLVMAAAGAEVIALEEHQEWALKTDALLTECGLEARVAVCPMNGRWFDISPPVEAMLSAADMIFIDGPRRRDGMDRMRPLALVKPGTAVLADDVAKIERKGEWESFDGPRPFTAGRLG